MKPLPGNQQLGLASLPKYAAIQSGKTKNPLRRETGLDASHNPCVSLEGREKNFFLTSSLSKNLLSGGNLRKLKSKFCRPFPEQLDLLLAESFFVVLSPFVDVSLTVFEHAIDEAS